MTCKCSLGSFQHLLLLVLLLGVGGVVYTYYKANTTWEPCQGVAASKSEICSDKCLSILKENFTTRLRTRTLKQQPPNNKLEDMEENKENHDHDTVLLVWSWPFGYRFKGESCASLFGIEGCHFTDDRSQYDKAHGVMFHHRDIGGELPNLQKRPRPPRQKWVWMNMESPDNSQRWTGLDGVFNLTSNYRRDSDVCMPFGRIVEASEKDKTFKIPPKDKLVCWIISNWNPNLQRVQYFSELRKYIKIEAYGKPFNRSISNDDYTTTVSSCKFYLSFENSIHKDYITEKLFNPMKLGSVPVVLGPPRENYEQFIPADSFIHVDDFKSPEELAKHLTFLDQNQNQDVYEKYFTWRQHFNAVRSYFGQEHVCHICDYIKRYKGYRVVKNLSKWYWG